MKKLCILLLFLTAACHKDVGPATETEWQNCREKLSKAVTAKKLVGEWKLVATACGDCLNPGIHPAKKEVILSFSEDRKTVVEREEGVPAVTTEFELVDSYNGGFYQIKTKPPYDTHYTHGIVEFCKGSFAFKNSYVDGEDFYFDRVK